MKNRNITFTAILLVLACFALSPAARAVVPAPDGGYPGLNTAEGQNALLGLTTGSANTAVGWFSLKSDATGGFNTALGAGTLAANTGDQNTATGAAALFSNTTGASNTATGAAALFSNTTGAFNTANGALALFSNTTGYGNTATGVDALIGNTTGGGNTANGAFALRNNTASNNTATGFNALLGNITGSFNTAVGLLALADNTTGSHNTAIGDYALFNATGNITGSFNTATGERAGTLITSGSHNVCVGDSAGSGITIHNNIIAIGAGVSGISSAFGEVDNSCYIGNIFGKSVDPIGGTTVRVDSDGKLGTTLSSKRFKHDIKPMDKASEAILALKPVTFHYRSDAKNTPCFGLIAEEVAAVDPDLVVRDKKGEIWSVRYDEVNAMLLNEFLKEHKTVQELKAKVQKQEVIIAQQQDGFQSTLARQQKQIEALASGLQKVSARFEASKPVLQIASKKQ